MLDSLGSLDDLTSTMVFRFRFYPLVSSTSFKSSASPTGTVQAILCTLSIVHCP